MVFGYFINSDVDCIWFQILHFNAVLNADKFGTGCAILLLLSLICSSSFCSENGVNKERQFLVFVFELVKLILGLLGDGFEVGFDSFDFEDEDEADKGCPSDLGVVFLVGGVDKFLEKGLGGGESVGEVFYLGHEEGVETVDGFEFEVVVVLLLNGSFEVVSDESVNIFKFS